MSKLIETNAVRDHTGSFAYTLEVIRTLEQQAEEEIQRLGGNAQLLAILKRICAV